MALNCVSDCVHSFSRLGFLASFVNPFLTLRETINFSSVEKFTVQGIVDRKVAHEFLLLERGKILLINHILLLSNFFAVQGEDVRLVQKIEESLAEIECEQVRQSGKLIKIAAKVMAIETHLIHFRIYTRQNIGKIPSYIPDHRDIANGLQLFQEMQSVMLDRYSLSPPSSKIKMSHKKMMISLLYFAEAVNGQLEALEAIARIDDSEVERRGGLVERGKKIATLMKRALTVPQDPSYKYIWQQNTEACLEAFEKLEKLYDEECKKES